MKSKALVSLLHLKAVKRSTNWQPMIPKVLELVCDSEASVASLSMALWSLVKMGCRDPSVITPILDQISQRNSISSRDLSSLSQALRAVDLYPLWICLRMETVCLSSFSSFSAIDQWNVLYYLSSCPTFPSRTRLFLRVIPDLKLSEISAKGLSSLAQAFAKTLYAHPVQLEGVLRNLSSEFVTRPDRSDLGSALMAKALAPVISPEDPTWKFLLPSQKLTAFEYVLFIDAFATNGSLCDGDLKSRMARIGQKFSFNPEEISRLAGLFSRSS